MARRVDKKSRTRSAPKGADAAQAAELDVLVPERTIQVNGEKVTVNEIGFVDGLRLQAHVAPVVAAIVKAMQDADEAPTYGAIVAVFGQHWESTLELICTATGKDRAWLDRVPSPEGELLLMTFWTVNAGFFINRAMNEVAIQREQARLLAGQNSSPPSSPTATGPTTSADTPPAS